MERGRVMRCGLFKLSPYYALRREGENEVGGSLKIERRAERSLVPWWVGGVNTRVITIFHKGVPTRW